MPLNIFLHQHEHFQELLNVVADEKKIDPYLIEKDYWIMHCLYGLQYASYDFQLKGGTSLSKGYGIIHRFSEDIDIHITPPAALHIKTGKNHNKPSQIQVRKHYYDGLAKEISIPGIAGIERATEFDDAQKYRSGGIRLFYDSLFATNHSDAKEGVLLEVGFDDIAPNKPIDISSWAFDFAASKNLDVIDNRAVSVLCYEPNYTFVEKLQAITTKFRQFQENGTLPANFMRHYYDIYYLLQQKEVVEFIGTTDYKRHKAKRFPKQDLKVPLRENEALLLSDPENFAALEKEYKSKSSLYYQGQPSLRAVIEEIEKYCLRL